MTRYAQGVIPHGTANGYQNYRCRCFQCREAFNLLSAQHRDRRRERNVCMECGDPAVNGTRCDKHAAINRERAHKCMCGHRRQHHKPECTKCGCTEFQRIVRKKAAGGWQSLSPNDRQAALSKMRDTLKARWAERFPGVDPEVAKAIYREGYQAGHQRARETAKRKILDRIA